MPSFYVPYNTPYPHIAITSCLIWCAFGPLPKPLFKLCIFSVNRNYEITTIENIGRFTLTLCGYDTFKTKARDQRAIYRAHE